MRVGNKIDWGVKEGKFGGNGDGSRRFRTHESAFRKETQKCGSGKEGERRRKGEQVGRGPENFDLFEIVLFVS